MARYAMISARALGAMPRFIEAEAGARGLDRACAAAGLPLGIENDDKGFIPQRSLMAFVEEAARLVGDERVGLALAPHLTPADYGVWGAYVLSAPTLADALHRAQCALGWHSTGDELVIDRCGELVRFAYRFASAGGPGYENIAYCAAGVLVGLFRAYLGRAWRPERIEMDLAPGRSMARPYDSFGCDVRSGGHNVAVFLRPDALSAPPAQYRTGPTVTLADVRRTRAGGAPERLPDVVRELVRIQLADSAVSLERLAEGLALGPRTLQRELAGHGASFRDIVDQVRLDRARALLAERDLSITRIAGELDYSAPSHFARAFQRRTGLSPRRYRKEIARLGG